MQRRSTATWVWALLAGGLTVGAAPASAAQPNCAVGNKVSRSGKVKRLNVVGLTADGRLVCFGDRSPDKDRAIGPITGLGSADGALVGIDFRVQDGLLYGLGNGGGVYRLDLATGQATLVSQLSETLAPAPEYDIDFNPAADRLRIVSSAGQNLRHNVNVGGTTTLDTSLAYTPAGPSTVGGAAYTNNDLDAATATSLFDLDTTPDQVALQSPPNAGSLAATGKLGVDAGPSVGFDVFSALVGGVTVGNHGFASLDVGGVRGFYRIDLLTGNAALVKPFVASVVDIAIPLAIQ